jgi:hypothetical protein
LITIDRIVMTWSSPPFEKRIFSKKKTLRWKKIENQME